MKRIAFIAAMLLARCVAPGGEQVVAWKINELPESRQLFAPRYLYEDEAEFLAWVPAGADGKWAVRIDGPGDFAAVCRLEEWANAPYNVHKPKKATLLVGWIDAATWPEGGYTAQLVPVGRAANSPTSPAKEDAERPSRAFEVVRAKVRKRFPQGKSRAEVVLWLEHVNRTRDVWKKVPRWRNVDRLMGDEPPDLGELRGLVLRGYRNEQLMQIQPYGMYVPEAYDPDEPMPLLILLHGSGGNYLNLLSDLYEGQELETHPMLVANAGAFRRQEYRHLALLDVLGVLADVKRKYNVDPDRVYLQGISLGGRGCIEIAALKPQLFAAASPQGVYGMLEPLADPVTALRMTSRNAWALAKWDIRSYLPNVRTVPMQIIYGHKDKTTPPLNALTIKYLINRLGGRARAVGFDAGHDISAPAYLWSETRKWMLEQRRAEPPGRIRFRCATLRHNKHWWVTVDDFDAWRGPLGLFGAGGPEVADVEADISDETLQFTRLDGVRRVTVDLPAEVKRVRVSSDLYAQSIALPSRPDRLTLLRGAGKWSAVDAARLAEPSETVKAPPADGVAKVELPGDCVSAAVELAGTGSAKTLRIGEGKLDLNGRRNVQVVKDVGGRWRLLGRAPQTKRHGRSGPIWDVNFRPCVAVYGAGGDAEQTARLKKAAEVLARLDTAWGRASWDVIPDTDVPEVVRKKCNLILVGDAKTHKLIAAPGWWPLTQKPQDEPPRPICKGSVGIGHPGRFG